VLQDVDRDVAVKKAVLEVEACLAVAGDDFNVRKTISHFRRHGFAQLDGVVVDFLLRRQLLVADVFAEAGADLDRSPESGIRMLDLNVVVKRLYESKAAGKLLEPELHERIARPCLLRRHRR
jgi:hypothetical protein